MICWVGPCILTFFCYCCFSPANLFLVLLFLHSILLRLFFLFPLFSFFILFYFIFFSILQFFFLFILFVLLHSNMQFFLARVYPNVTSGNFFLLLFFFADSPSKPTHIRQIIRLSIPHTHKTS